MCEFSIHKLNRHVAIAGIKSCLHRQRRNVCRIQALGLLDFMRVKGLDIFHYLRR